MPEKSKQSRRRSRIVALKAIFYFFQRNEKIEMKKCLTFVQKELERRSEDVFAKELTQAVIDHAGSIKVTISAYAPSIHYDKIVPINRAILSLGIAEIKYIKTPPVVAINEYIEICKEYAEKNSTSLVNGVLDQLQKNIKK